MPYGNPTPTLFLRDPHMDSPVAILVKITYFRVIPKLGSGLELRQFYHDDIPCINS
jgi:hypothetical protein